MNCQEALDLIYDILDKEASEIDTKQVHDHLEKCHHCLERYKIEGDVHSFIKAKLHHAEAGTVESLRHKILGKLDAIDREEGAQTGHKPPFWRTSYTFAAAALLVVTIGAAYLVAGFYRHQNVYMPLERAHWSARDGMSAYQNEAVTSATLAYATDTVGYRVFPDIAGARLIGGQTEEIEGTRMAHFVYANPGEKVVSVFVVPADQFTIPDNLKETRAMRHGLNLFDHNCRGCRLVYHQIGSVVVITATSDRETELLDFVPGQTTI